MKNEQAKHDAWLRGEYEYTPEEVKEMQKDNNPSSRPEGPIFDSDEGYELLGPNAQIFERVVMTGLKEADLSPYEFLPFVAIHPEYPERGYGFGICQLKPPKQEKYKKRWCKALETVVVMYEHGIEWNLVDSEAVLVCDEEKEQYAYMLGVLILTHIMTKNPISPPTCPDCENTNIRCS